MLTQARTVGHRVYADFLMPTRLGAFEGLLRRLLEAGYSVISIETLCGMLGAGGLPEGHRYAVLRHDVDTDPRTAGAMWAIERGLGVKGSYFFRLSTLDLPLMQAIAASGSGVGYHYEELATVAKRRRLHTKEQALRHLPEAREEFVHNIGMLRAQTGLPLGVAASHGDFVNRRLGVPNWVILADGVVRAQVGIRAEAYDADVNAPITARFNDTLHPRYWVPEAPTSAIDAGSPAIYLLVHPRHWRIARRVNAIDDMRRVTQALGLSLPFRQPAA